MRPNYDRLQRSGEEAINPEELLQFLPAGMVELMDAARNELGWSGGQFMTAFHTLRRQQMIRYDGELLKYVRRIDK